MNSRRTGLVPPVEENVSRGKEMKSGQRMIQHNSTTSRKRQRCHILTLLPVTKGEGAIRTPIAFRVYNEASAWLAWYHLVNPAESTVLPNVADRLASCSVDFSMRMGDTRFSALNAARQLLQAVNETNLSASGTSETDNMQPTAVVGAARSTVTTALSFLTSAFGIPQISGSSTAKSLNRKDRQALFGRTVPTNRGDAQAITLYLSNLGVTHIGILYIADEYGTSFRADLVNELVSAGIDVFSQGYVDSSAEIAMQYLVSSGMRYFVGIFNPETWRPLVELAFRHGIMGHPDYFWMLTESSLEITHPAFELNRTNESHLARALHGSGLLSLTVPTHGAFDKALQTFSESQEQQDMFVNQHTEPEIFEGFAFPIPGRSLYQYLTYDAVMALAIAACETPYIAPHGEVGVFGMGEQLYNQFLKTEFEGVSGNVTFDPFIGTRRSTDLLYQVQNIVFSDELSTETRFRYTSNVSALVDLDAGGSVVHVEGFSPFLYSNNGTLAPLQLSPVEMNMNLLSPSVKTCGLLLNALVMIASIGWMVWTFVEREKDVVRASQPIFLIQICVGTLIAASSVIPMSMQEPTSQQRLNTACMATPWLISVGFVTVFSALFSKTWRLNKLFSHGRAMRRVIVRHRDVVLPFLILLISNFAVLITWTIDSPEVWERSAVENFDVFGRSVESTGSCKPSNSTAGAVYATLSIAVNLLALLFANYQAYHARDLPTDYSESAYIFVAMASLLEACLLGIPLVFLAKEDRTSSFLIRSILLSISCLSILLPIFLPKWIQRNTNKRSEDSNVNGTAHSSTARRRSIVHVSFAGSDCTQIQSEYGNVPFGNKPNPYR